MSIHCRDQSVEERKGQGANQKGIESTDNQSDKYCCEVIAIGDIHRHKYAGQLSWSGKKKRGLWKT